MLFEFVQIAYWLALSPWFGAVLFVALAPPIIQRTVRESNPVLPNVLSVNLEGQHGTLLAGMIMQNLFASLVWIELACAGVLLVATVLHFFLIDVSGGAVLRPIVRIVLLIAAL